jgi:hypothetical protein
MVEFTTSKNRKGKIRVKENNLVVPSTYMYTHMKKEKENSKKGKLEERKIRRKENSKKGKLEERKIRRKENSKKRKFEERKI